MEIREYILYILNPFTFIEAYFTAQGLINIIKFLCPLEKNVQSAVVGCNVSLGQLS